MFLYIELLIYSTDTIENDVYLINDLLHVLYFLMPGLLDN